MEIVVRTALSPEESRKWTAFLERSAHAHPRQDLRMGELERAVGFTPLYVIGSRRGETCAVGLFILRPRGPRRLRLFEAIVRSGPVCDDAATLVEFLDAAVEQPPLSSALLVRISPYWLDDDARALTALLARSRWERSEPAEYRTTGLFDVTRSEEEIRASFSRSGRRKVRLAEKAGIEVRPITTMAGVELFHDRLNRLNASRSLTAIPRAEYERGFELVYTDPSIGVILGAYHRDRFVGGYLSYRSRTTAFARSYVTDPETDALLDGLRIAPILWLHGMLWAKAQGCSRVDAEGWRVVTDVNDPKFKIYEYKGEFNPSPAIRVAEHTCVLRPAFRAILDLPATLRAGFRQSYPELSRNLRNR